MVQPLWKIILWFLKKFNLEWPYDLAISALGIYPKELKAKTQTDTCTPVFISALFMIVKKWKQLSVYQ